MPGIYQISTLISEAYYTSGIVSRGFQQVASDQVQTGFIKLNEIITDMAIEEDMLPYFSAGTTGLYQYYQFNAVPGQEEYFIPYLVRLETLVFYIQSIRYSMSKVSQDIQFGQARAENVQSLPYNWHYERTYQAVYPYNAVVNQSSTNAVVNGLLIVITDPTLTVNSVITATMQNSENHVSIIGTSVGAGTLTVTLSGAPGATWQLSYSEGDPTYTPGSNLWLYFFPDQAYPMVLTGLFQLKPFISVYDDLYTRFDNYVITYLQYRLAERLCIAYNFALPEQTAKQLVQYQMLISKRSSPIDVSMNKISTLSKTQTISYAMCNLGHGFYI